MGQRSALQDANRGGRDAHPTPASTTAPSTDRRGTPPDPPDRILLFSNASGAPIARLASIDPEDKARAFLPVTRHRTRVLDDVFFHTACGKARPLP